MNAEHLRLVEAQLAYIDAHLRNLRDLVKEAKKAEENKNEACTFKYSNGPCHQEAEYSVSRAGTAKLSCRIHVLSRINEIIDSYTDTVSVTKLDKNIG